MVGSHMCRKEDGAAPISPPRVLVLFFPAFEEIPERGSLDATLLGDAVAGSPVRGWLGGDPASVTSSGCLWVLPTGGLLALALG